MLVLYARGQGFKSQAMNKTVRAGLGRTEQGRGKMHHGHGTRQNAMSWDGMNFIPHQSQADGQRVDQLEMKNDNGSEIASSSTRRRLGRQLTT
mmetsp:Transcript_13318/g.29121  ORF Transcript_13318/g.29121 Transcript_13318/m.29121 type:complete len:93 (+) Transcript_13318:66-344(+)